MFTPVEIVMRRAGVDEYTAAYYVGLASMRVRQQLKLDSDVCLTDYTFPVSDIATLMWQSDTSTKQSSATLGYQSKSFSEGGVSKSETGMTGQAIWNTYESAIQDVLNNLDGGAGKAVFI